MLRFLVVDDYPGTTAALAKLLKADGHCVQTCHSGCDALEALARSEFDVLLVDWELTPISGESIARATRELQPEVCVIVSSTAKALPLAAVACHVFSQPLDYERFERTVVTCWARRRASRSGYCRLREGPPFPPG